LIKRAAWPDEGSNESAGTCFGEIDRRFGEALVAHHDGAGAPMMYGIGHDVVDGRHADGLRVSLALPSGNG
jgi:hypothetical protein